MESPSGRGSENDLRDDAAERRQLTVLFCDLVGSTALSEQMDPEDLRLVLRDYQRRCATVLRHFDGYIAQYLGDGILVYFGYPNADESAARRAVEAGLGVLAAMGAAKSDARLPQRLGVRVGIHTGPVVVGDMGDASRPERLAVGATPNMAARVQAEAEPDSLLLSDATHALVAGYFDCEPMGVRQLRGISRPSALHRVLGRGPASTRLEASEQRGFSPFAGRERELAMLVDGWTAGLSQGRAVLVSGDSGVGKSRLVLELTRAVAAKEVVQFTASESAQSEPLFPIVTYLRQWAGLSSIDNPALRREKLASRLDALDLGAALPELAVLLSIESASSLQGAPSLKRHAALIQRLVELFSALSRARPLLVIFEDLQWADASTLQFLEAWLVRRKEIRALTLATARAGARVVWAESAGFEVLALGPLARESARVIARSLAQRLGADPPEELLERVLDRADGVPLFVEELTRTLAELASVGPSSLLPARRSDPVPASLQDSLMARLDRLGSAKAIAQLAAVVGREVPLSWLDQVSPVGTDVLRGELARLIASGLMEERAGTDATYVFTHALMHEAAYESLVKTAREELHQRVAEMLLSHHVDLVKHQPLMLARHYIAAGRTEKALRYLMDAGQRMLTVSAFVEAIDVFYRAVDLLASIGKSGARDALEIELLSSLGLALISTRGYSSDEVEDVYSRARQLCERGDVPLPVLYGVWAAHLVRSDARGLNRLAPLFSRIVETARDADQLLIARSCLAVRAFYRVNFAEARTHLRAASDLIDLSSTSAQHERMLASYSFDSILSGPVWLAWVAVIEGNEDEARAELHKALRLSEQIGDPYIICQVAAYMASLSRELRDVGIARSLTDRALALSGEYGLVFWQALALCARSWVSLQEGMPHEAVTLARDGLAIFDAVGSVVNRPYFSTYLLEAQLQAADYEAALQTADESLLVCRESLGPMYEPEILRLKGLVLLELGSEESAMDCLQAALAQSRLQGARLLEVRAATSLGRLFGRRKMFAQAREVLEASGAKWPSSSAAPDLEEARAALASLPTP